MEKYQTNLRRMCYAMPRDEELSKDAVQETFLKMYQTMDAFRDECSEKTYLMRIAVNSCRDIRRSAWLCHRDRWVTVENLPETCSQAEMESVELTLSIMRLPKQLQEVTILYYYQDMTIREVVQALNVSPSTVSKRLNHAQAKLHAWLKGGKS